MTGNGQDVGLWHLEFGHSILEKKDMFFRRREISRNLLYHHLPLSLLTSFRWACHE